MKARGRPPVESGAIRCRAGRRHRGLAVLALVAAAASLAAPPPASPQAMSFTVEGKITDHSKGKLTINSEQNIIFHVRYDEKTEIEGRDGKAATEKDLERGVKVKIEGDLEESGEIAANRIEIEEEAKPQKRSAVQAA